MLSTHLYNAYLVQFCSVHKHTHKQNSELIRRKTNIKLFASMHSFPWLKSCFGEPEMPSHVFSVGNWVCLCVRALLPLTASACKCRLPEASHSISAKLIKSQLLICIVVCCDCCSGMILLTLWFAVVSLQELQRIHRVDCCPTLSGEQISFCKIIVWSFF